MRRRQVGTLDSAAVVVLTLSAVWLTPAARVVQAKRFFGIRTTTKPASLKASILSKSSSRLAVDAPSRHKTEFSSSPAASLLATTRFRGGSTKPAEADPKKSKTTDDSTLHTYRLQQQLYLQSRSLQLRQALIERGLTELQHSETDHSTPKAVDWDCAMATAAHPKSCLYSFDAQHHSKVIAPLDTTQWITLAALNRLRRNDPTKVEPLWHSQYHILKTWFHPNNSPFSLYTHLSPAGTLLSCLLDAPFLLAASMLVVFSMAMLVTFPIWESLLRMILMSPVVWMQWHQWGRFVHAALPLKLLLGQLAWKGLATVFTKVYQQARGRLVEWECQIMEQCIPVTVIEDDDDSGSKRMSRRSRKSTEADDEDSFSYDNEEDDDDDDETEEEDEEEDEFEDEEEDGEDY